MPALTAHFFARTIHQFRVLPSPIGEFSAFIGFWITYQWNFPVGPTDVVLLGGLYTAGKLQERKSFCN